jgi:hypothetical protein
MMARGEWRRGGDVWLAGGRLEMRVLRRGLGDGSFDLYIFIFAPLAAALLLCCTYATFLCKQKSRLLFLITPLQNLPSCRPSFTHTSYTKFPRSA